MKEVKQLGNKYQKMKVEMIYYWNQRLMKCYLWDIIPLIVAWHHKLRGGEDEFRDIRSLLNFKESWFNPLIK